MKLTDVDLETCRVEERAVAMIPRPMAEKYGLIAIACDETCLTVAVHDPMDLYALEDVRLVTNRELKLVRAPKEAVARAIELYYSEIDIRIAADRAVWQLENADPPLAAPAPLLLEEQAPIGRLLNNLLIRAYNTNVSDIHIEPFETGTVVRMRRDGLLLPYLTLSPVLHQGLVARTKILAQMDIAEKRRPQDGHFKTRINEEDVNLRVSFIPTAHGEKGVLRFLAANTRIDHSETFGMEETSYQAMQRLLKYPNGMIYVTGPTGSGKTTTLYAVLQHLAKKPLNITTIEDPVEKQMPGINQMQINEKAGITFERSLRALLRQDPDIIMVGETRDQETARVAARAAVTGHLVFSTLHTNSAAASVARLQDMGVETYLLSASLKGIVAQRLVKKICPYCKEAYEERESGEIRYRGKGCRLCGNTGVKGRRAIYEILEIDEGMKELISRRRPVEEMERYAREQLHMETLKEAAYKLVKQGIISSEEMENVTYGI